MELENNLKKIRHNLTILKWEIIITIGIMLFGIGVLVGVLVS